MPSCSVSSAKSPWHQVFGNRSLEERRERNGAATSQIGLLRSVLDGPQIDGTVYALQRMHTDRHKRETGPPADEQPHGVRHKNLTTVGRVAHPRSHRHRQSADVTVVGGDLAGVDPDPHTDLVRVAGSTVVEQHALLDALTGDNRIHGRIENGKRAVAEVLHEPAAGTG